MKNKRIFYLLTLVLALSLVFASCGAQSNGMAYDKGFDYAVTEEAEFSTTGSASYSSNDSLKDTATSGAVTDNRKIIKNAEMSVQTKTFDTFIEDLKKKINECGGYVESSSLHGNSYSQNGNRSAEYVVRVPAENLNAFKDGVTTLGNVTYYNESQKDVTTSYIDVESRITALTTEQTTLLELLTKSEDLESLLKVQSRLTEVNYELENYKSQLRAYDSQISYSKVTVNIREVERVTTLPSKQTIWERISTDFVNNTKDIANGAGDVFVWFVSSIPYLILLAIPVVIIILIVRRNIKKDKKRRNNLPPPTFTPPQA